MMDKVAKKVARSIQVDGWTAEKMSEVESIRKDMKRLLRDTNRVAKAEVQQSLIDTYMNGVNAQNKHYGLPKTIMEAENVPLSLQRLILESDGLIDGTSFQVLRNTDDAYRNIISQLSTGVLTGVETKQQVAQRALNAFAAKGITGFTDKAGRKWNLGSYIDMAVRTTTARAALQGHVDRATELGYDLIRVSNLYSTCPICAPWNGAILSVSGNTLKYKSLESAKAAGLFHPNCMHTLTAYSEEYDEIDRMLGQKTVENEQNDLELYEATQQQRSNERKIRQWRRMEAVALDPASKARAQAKIRQYQGVQRELISKYEQFGLKRQYARERLGKVTGVETVKEFEKLKLTKDVHTVVQPVAPVVQPAKPVITGPDAIKVIKFRGSNKTFDEIKGNGLGSMADAIAVHKKVLGITKDEIFEAYAAKSPKLDEWLQEIFDKSGSVVVQKKVVSEVMNGKKQVLDIAEIKSLKNFDKHRLKRDYKKNLGDIKVVDKAIDVLKEVTEKSELRMRIPGIDVMNKILDSGRFKSQHEVRSSKGVYTPAVRKTASKNMFGFDAKDMDKSDYEIYGYIWDSSFVTDAKYSKTSSYGNIVVQLKKEVRERTTITIGDSLFAAQKRELLPAKLTDMDYCWRDLGNSKWAQQTANRISDIGDLQKADRTIENIIDGVKDYSYIEAQYHGGLNTDMIETVVFDSRLTPNQETGEYFKKMKKSLDDLGVKVGYYDHVTDGVIWYK
jgi:hypothetical protein